MSLDDQESREKRDQGDAPQEEASGKNDVAPSRDDGAASGSSGESSRPETEDAAGNKPSDIGADSPTTPGGTKETSAEEELTNSGSGISDVEQSSESGGVDIKNTVAVGSLAGNGVTESSSAQVSPHHDESRATASYYDDPHSHDYDYQHDDPYAGAGKQTAVAKSPPPPPPPPASGDDDFDEQEEGMVRMSFLDHLEELRTRILRSLYGLGAAYLGALVYARELYSVAAGPFEQAVRDLPYDPPLRLVAITAMEQFHLIYIKIPLLVSIFLASPWLMYQAWSFIAPGLYRRERRWALPFIFSTAILFVLGGVFGYVVALRYALAFLIGIGLEQEIMPMISIDSYFDLFIGVMLGLGLVFQMPVLIFFLTLLKIVTPQFLIRNMRYAILIIFVIAAIITPTADVFNLILFAGPMILLFYIGIAASYLLTLHRESRRLPWGRLLLLVLLIFALAAGAAYFMHVQLGYEFSGRFPWLVPPQSTVP